MDERRVVGVVACPEAVDAIVFTKAENFGVEASATLPEAELPEIMTSLLAPPGESPFTTAPPAPVTGPDTTGVDITGVDMTGVEVTTGTETTGVDTTGVTTGT